MIDITKPEKIKKSQIEEISEGVLSELGMGDKTLDEMIGEYNITPIKLKYLLVYCKKLEFILNRIKKDYVFCVVDEKIIENLNKTLSDLRDKIGRWE